MIKRKLILELEDVPEEFSAIGIVSSTPHLELVHLLNRSEWFNLIRKDDLFLSEPKAQHFMQFESIDEATENRMVLIKTKGDKSILSSEFKGIDYLVIIFANDDLSFHNDLLIYFRTQKNVQAVVDFNQLGLSDKASLLFGSV
ncbi:MAG: IPExxxVDY family protein [Flavobacteriales bacterium]|nr:IPExxxVDY family protein [Flavobacteriales bacterium]